MEGDSIYIREHSYRNAKITGAVSKPGSYIMSPGETLNDLVKKAGGFTKNAYIFGSVYQTEEAKSIYASAKQTLYEEFLDNIIKISQESIGQTFDIGPVVALAQDIKNSEISGRVVVDMLDEASIDLNPVKEGDDLFVPEINNVVYIFGETSTEGAMTYVPNRKVEYYINKTGGLKTSAAKKSIYILHPNGETDLYAQRKSIFQSSPDSAVNIYPGSVIFVPRELDNAVPRRLAAQANASILSSLALSIASLSSLSD
jgi:protein involved in polysaccharide export with SLBB domain